LYCFGSMCVGVTVWFGWGGVVSLCRLKQRCGLAGVVWYPYALLQPAYGYHTTPVKP